MSFFRSSEAAAALSVGAVGSGAPQLTRNTAAQVANIQGRRAVRMGTNLCREDTDFPAEGCTLEGTEND
jgi:hypothetical protein